MLVNSCLRNTIECILSHAVSGRKQYGAIIVGAAAVLSVQLVSNFSLVGAFYILYLWLVI